MWQCFGCHQKGNPLDFIGHMEGLDMLNGTNVRKAAEIAQEKFLKGPESKPQPAKPQVKKAQAESEPTKTVINAPLDFTLKSLDPNHPWFKEQGLSKETVEHFGLGYCSKGWLKGRIAIPLHDNEGRLIGYAGRLLDKREATVDDPLYVFPKTRVHEKVVYEFNPNNLIYRSSLEPSSEDEVIVTSVIEAVWRLWQLGFRQAVAVLNIELKLQSMSGASFKFSSSSNS